MLWYSVLHVLTIAASIYIVKDTAANRWRSVGGGGGGGRLGRLGRLGEAGGRMGEAIAPNILGVSLRFKQNYNFKLLDSDSQSSN